MAQLKLTSLKTSCIAGVNLVETLGLLSVVSVYAWTTYVKVYDFNLMEENWRGLTKRTKLLELTSSFNQVTHFSVYSSYSKSCLSFVNEQVLYAFPYIQPDSSCSILPLNNCQEAPLLSFFPLAMFPLVSRNSKYFAYNCESLHLHTIFYRLFYKFFLQILQIIFHQAILLLTNLK